MTLYPRPFGLPAQCNVQNLTFRPASNSVRVMRPSPSLSKAANAVFRCSTLFSAAKFSVPAKNSCRQHQKGHHWISSHQDIITILLPTLRRESKGSDHIFVAHQL